MSEKNPYFGATFAERKAIREAAEKTPTPKAVTVDEDAVEDKAITSAEPKRPVKKKA